MSDLLADQKAKATLFCGYCLTAAGFYGSRQIQLSTCSKCKSIQYCSKECQKKHWNVHKTFCGKNQEKTSEILASFVSSESILTALAVYAIVALKLDPTRSRPKVEDPLLRFRIELDLVPVDQSQSTHLEIARMSKHLSKDIEMMLDVKAISKLDQNAPIVPMIEANYRAIEGGARRAFATNYEDTYAFALFEVFAPSNAGTNLPNIIGGVPIFYKSFTAAAMLARGLVKEPRAPSDKITLTPQEMHKQLNGLIRRSDKDPLIAAAVRTRITVQEFEEYWVADP